MKKRGISLIVLIITIIVVIILAAVVILTLSKNNPIESAKEARFKEDVRTFQDELALTVSKQYTTAGGHRDEKITTSDFEKIKEYIPSFSEKYNNKFLIEDDELKYTNVTDQEKEWCDSLYIKNKLYTELEYIESTGEQWIDSKLRSNSELIIDINLTALVYDSSSLFGSRTNEGNCQIALVFYERSGTWGTFVRHANGELHYANVKIGDLNINKKYNIYISNEKVFVDGNYVAEIQKHTFDDDGYSMSIFGFRNSTTGQIISCAKYRLYNLKIYKKDILIRDYIPVLDQNNKPALYDKVEGKFYYNQGTGEDFKYKLKE